mgnify:CR=1 FL=1
MKRLNYIDLGVHKGQEIDMVLKDYAEYQHKFEKANLRVSTYQRMLMQITTNIPKASKSLYELTETMNMLEKKVGGTSPKRHKYFNERV